MIERLRRGASLAALLLVSALGLPSSAAAAAAPTASVVLQWTSPGDDGDLGIAFRYDLRVAEQPFDDSTFDHMTPVLGLPHPAPAGSPEVYEVTGLDADRVYYFALRTMDVHGNWSRMSNLVARTTGPTLLARGRAQLSTPWPNPARQLLRLDLGLPRATPVILDVLDVAGRVRRTLARGVYPAGITSFGWDLRDRFGERVMPGTYWVRALLGASQQVERFTVAR